MSTGSPAAAKSPLADPALRKQLEDFVRRRVPTADVDDVVQTVLCDALAARERPEGADELRRWVLGIARHKVVDLHRRAHKETPAELADLEAAPPPVEERGLVEWAEKQAGSTREGQKTLGWMAREGEGDKLETIAAEEQVPAARVRQRVSRMRRWMKERWLAELAAVAALAVLAFIAWRWLKGDQEVPEARPEKPVPSATPEQLDRARSLRADAMKRCEASEWAGCLDGLDAAKALDPAGDRTPEIGAARDQATRALAPRTDDTSSLAPPTAESAVPAPPPPSTASAAPPPAPKPTVAPKAPAKSEADVDNQKKLEAKTAYDKKAGKPAPKKPSGKGSAGDSGGPSDTPTTGGAPAGGKGDFKK